MTKEQKNALLKAIDGLLYRPVIKWDDDYEPYIAYEGQELPFTTLKELADGLRELADELDKYVVVEEK